MKGQNQAETKQKNKNLIIKLVITRAPISRIELSKITGLTKMAVTNIVGDLIEEGLIHEVGLSDTNAGRKPIFLDIVEKSRVIIGVYISRDSICCIAGDLKGNIICENTTILDNDNNISLMKKLTKLIDKTKKRLDNIIGIGISCIGPLNAKEGVILNPPNFFDIENLDIASQLKKKYNIPVFIDNDMNTSALAEKYFGKAKNIDNFIYIGVTNGIGAGIIANNRLYSGECGFGGEIGHITVETSGEKCSCGNKGCLEMYASFPKNWANLGEKEQNEKLNEICRYLSNGIITLINLFDPQIIYIGHDIAVTGDVSIKLINNYISARYISRRYKIIAVEKSTFEEKSPVYGTIALCVDRLFGNS